MTTGVDAGVVVIGSGPCGAIAARELTDRGIPLTMLEAGARPPAGIIVRAAGHTVARWRSYDGMDSERHQPRGDPPIQWYSSLSPGGLSNYWSAAVPRFAPEDFTEGGRLDARFVWPVEYEELVPFYEMAEDLLCITGAQRSLPVLPAGRVRYRREMPEDWMMLERGQWLQTMTLVPLAIGRPWMVARRGSEFNSYHVIVRPLERCDSFRLVLRATVTRLVLDADGSRVTAVEYVDGATKQLRTIPATAVVLAAGTIDTTRLLLSSLPGAAPSDDGGTLIGRYLHDHPKVWWPAQLTTPMTVLDHTAVLTREPYADAAPLTGCSATMGRASSADRLRSAVHRKSDRVGAQVFGTMVPKEDDRVRLTDGTDRLGLPRVDLDIAYDDRALGTLRAARRRVESMFAAGGNPATVEMSDWVPRPGNSVHFAGTARMHADPRLGVVDGWNRVHGIPNVVVADMACFTTNPEKNPTLTAMALSARASRHLAATL